MKIVSAYIAIGCTHLERIPLIKLKTPYICGIWVKISGSAVFIAPNIEIVSAFAICKDIHEVMLNIFTNCRKAII
jgi:hypothetical protein